MCKGFCATDLFAAKINVAAADLCVCVAAVSVFCACEKGGGGDYGEEESGELHCGVEEGDVEEELNWLARVLGVWGLLGFGGWGRRWRFLSYLGNGHRSC